MNMYALPNGSYATDFEPRSIVADIRDLVGDAYAEGLAAEVADLQNARTELEREFELATHDAEMCAEECRNALQDVVELIQQFHYDTDGKQRIHGKTYAELINTIERVAYNAL